LAIKLIINLNNLVFFQQKEILVANGLFLMS